MIDGRILQRATTVGILLQITMVVLGHYIAWIAVNVFMFGWLFIAGIAGLLYARDLDRGWRLGALGGIIAGTICAAIGILVSVGFRDTPATLIPIIVLASALTGAVGGMFGQMAANMDRLRLR